MNTTYRYEAKVVDRFNYNFWWTILNFDESFLDKDLWANVFSEFGSCLLKINDAKVSDEDMYHLGFRKVISIKKTKIIEEETSVYER